MRRFRSSMMLCMLPVASTTIATSTPTFRNPPTYFPNAEPSDHPAPPPPPVPHPPTPPAPAAGADPPRAGARRGEARPEVHARAERPRRAREAHDGRGRVRRRLVGDGNGLGPGRSEELLQGLLRRRVGGWHRLRHV